MSRPIHAPARLLALLALTLPCAFAAHAADRFEVGAGVSFTRDNEDTPVFAAAWLPEWREYRGGTLRWEIGAMHVRGRSDSHYDNFDDVTVVHAGLRYERPSGLVAGFGAGVQSGKTEALSGDPQVISTFGWRWNRFSLLARHISNASIHQPNDGETMLQAAWRF